MIVVDLGCMSHGPQRSILPLLKRFHPTELLGFDPLLPRDTESVIEGTQVKLSRKAAWVHEGQVTMMVGETPWEIAGSTLMHAHTKRAGRETIVGCFDLAAFLRATWERDHAVVLKMDVEGAEYPLLDHLVNTGVDQLVTKYLIEWHDVPGCSMTFFTRAFEEWA